MFQRPSSARSANRSTSLRGRASPRATEPYTVELPDPEPREPALVLTQAPDHARKGGRLAFARQGVATEVLEHRLHAPALPMRQLARSLPHFR